MARGLAYDQEFDPSQLDRLEERFIDPNYHRETDSFGNYLPPEGTFTVQIAEGTMKQGKQYPFILVQLRIEDENANPQEETFAAVLSYSPKAAFSWGYIEKSVGVPRRAGQKPSDWFDSIVGLHASVDIKHSAETVVNQAGQKVQNTRANATFIENPAVAAQNQERLSGGKTNEKDDDDAPWN